MDAVRTESSYDPQADSATMMALYGQTVQSTPQVPSTRECLLRGRLNFEEGGVELLKALGLKLTHQGQILNLDELQVELDWAAEPDLIQIADAIGDTLVVTYGLANSCGIDAQAVYQEVHRSNMSKFWIGPNGPEIRKRSDGKVLKPPTYSPADIEGVLAVQRQRAAARLDNLVADAEHREAAMGEQLSDGE